MEEEEQQRDSVSALPCVRVVSREDAGKELPERETRGAFYHDVLQMAPKCALAMQLTASCTPTDELDRKVLLQSMIEGSMVMSPDI